MMDRSSVQDNEFEFMLDCFRKAELILDKMIYTEEGDDLTTAEIRLRQPERIEFTMRLAIAFYENG